MAYDVAASKRRCLSPLGGGWGRFSRVSARGVRSGVSRATIPQGGCTACLRPPTLVLGWSKYMGAGSSRDSSRGSHIFGMRAKLAHIHTRPGTVNFISETITSHRCLPMRIPSKDGTHMYPQTDL